MTDTPYTEYHVTFLRTVTVFHNTNAIRISIDMCSDDVIGYSSHMMVTNLTSYRKDLKTMITSFLEFYPCSRIRYSFACIIENGNDFHQQGMITSSGRVLSSIIGERDGILVNIDRIRSVFPSEYFNKLKELGNRFPIRMVKLGVGVEIQPDDESILMYLLSN